MTNQSPLPPLLDELTRAGLDARADQPTRLLYSTDASIYQIEPLGVVFPRHTDELQAIVEACGRYEVPLVARGAGSSLGGQAIGAGLVVDTGRYLKRVLALDEELRIATVEPGVVLNALNRAAGGVGLQFGPDPASAERATLGGSIGNNAAGAHSIRYGLCVDHIVAAQVVLADGSTARLEALSLDEAARRAQGSGLEAAWYRTALDIRQNSADAIRQGWPRTWRRASGYALNYLLPWTPSRPPFWAGQADGLAGGLDYPPVQPGQINLAQLLAGSEGTLALMQQLTVRLSPVPKHTILISFTFPDLAAASDAAPGVLEAGPSAVELIPGVLIRLARSVPAYAAQLTLLNRLGAAGDEPPALLVVEFAGDDPAALKAQALALQARLQAQGGYGQALLAEGKAEQAQIWLVRKVGLGLIMSRPGDWRPYSFIEDLTVPVERLGEFVRGMERILAAHGVQGETYGHASAGCLHIRPILNLKTAQGVTLLRQLASEAVDLTLSLGGVVSGEHGDGLARSEWYGRMFSPEILAAMRAVKQAADPCNRLNPGKMVAPDAATAPPRMDRDLRFGVDYRAHTWQPGLAFALDQQPEAMTDGQTATDSLAAAIEQCNGAGVCRKAEGVMCPSFQATQEELYSTRGRANLLRALIAGRFDTHAAGEAAVFQTLDLCLACKGCKAECPSAVDVAKLKYVFMHDYYRRHRRKLRDYLFGYIGPIARLTHGFAPLVNPFLRMGWFTALFERLMGVSAKRRFPAFARRSLSQLDQAQKDKDRSLSESKLMRVANYTPIEKSKILLSDNKKKGHISDNGAGRVVSIAPIPAGTMPTSQPALPLDQVLFLSDPFSEYMQPQVGLAALEVLRRAGCQVTCLPVIGAGRTLISKGFLDAAQRHARQVLQAIQAADPSGRLPVVAVEPSELHALLDEYADLLPDDPAVAALAQRAWTVEEFLLRLGPTGVARIQALPVGDPAALPAVALHGHCYQKARPPAVDGLPVGVRASAAALQALGYRVQVLDTGCCGMAGAFGYESDHYDLSLQVGELSVFPAVRAAGEATLIVAAGVSCREQIEDGTQRSALHPVELMRAGIEAAFFAPARSGA